MKETGVLIVIIILGIIFFLLFDGLINQANILETLGLNAIKEKTQNLQNNILNTSNTNKKTTSESKNGEEYPKQNFSANESMNSDYSSENLISDSQNNNEQTEQTEIKEPAKSPYYKKIRISGFQKKTSYHPSLIRLRSYAFEDEEINITGWKIKTRHGEFKIPKGVEKYQSYMTEKDIIVDKHVYIYLIGENSPLKYQAFKTNKCFGYLKEYNEFYPSIYASCPKPKLEDISYLTPFCQEYILNLWGCKTPNYSSNLKIATDSACVKYINNNFNYSGCFKNYSQDEDFLKNYWYIYIKSDSIEPLHDTIYLYDRNNLLVDKYAY